VKTPREILLQHHRQVQPKLDAIRHAMLAEEPEPTNPRMSLREMLHTLRWHLAGISAVWLLVLVLHADTGPTPLLASVAPKPPPSQVMMASMREHRRLLSEMMDTPPTGGAPREPFLPKPRSESRPEFLIA
jgi:hypothetical protein